MIDLQELGPPREVAQLLVFERVDGTVSRHGIAEAEGAPPPIRSTVMERGAKRR
jgi:hypothetical protein